MSREIKFNLWDNEKKQYFRYALSLKNNAIEKWGTLELRTSNNVDWLQYTGLKDKNGVEIYEGDIDNKNRVCEYFPNLGSFGFKNPKYAPVTFLGQFIDRENFIIGNIYENPELLNK